MKNSSYWEEKNVFVTGGAGFLGSWLILSLIEKRANVVALIKDRVPNSVLFYSGADKKVTLIRGGLEDYSTIERSLNEYEIDTCFHLGAQAIVQTANRSPLSTFESNIKGTWNVLEAARNSELLERIVVATSDKSYGTKEKLPYSEEDCLQGLHPYDVSKTCADLLAQTYYNTYNLPVGISRCGNLYGGGDLNFSRVVPGTIRSLILDEDPIIRSDGTYVRDYFYIEDTVDAFITLGENLDRDKIKGDAFNFGTGITTTVLDVVNKLISLSGKSNLKPNILNEVRHEIKEQYLDCKKADRLLNWTPKHDLDTGLKKTIAWYETYLQGA